MDPLGTVSRAVRSERHRRSRAQLPSQSGALRLQAHQALAAEALPIRLPPLHLGGGGGGGGGGALSPSSANSDTDAHPAAPGRQACVDGGTCPLCTIARSASSVYGPYVLPSIASDQRGAALAEPPPGGGGGGVAPPWAMPPPNAEPIAPPMAK